VSDEEPKEGFTTSKRVEVESSGRVFDDFFTIYRACIRYEKFDGTMSEPLTRLVFERGDGVAVLPLDRQRREVVLVCQFRYPAYVRDDPAWLWEIIAGMCEEGRTVEDVAHSEAMEEAGYRLGALQHIMTVYLSPGGSSERMHIFLAPISDGDRVGQGGGLPDSGEDVLVRRFALEEALRMAEDGRIMDAKTILALQYLALHQADV
jgi:nudix-type nucleoside diphosphatase (YffH/AdpP family)